MSVNSPVSAEWDRLMETLEYLKLMRLEASFKHYLQKFRRLVNMQEIQFRPISESLHRLNVCLLNSSQITIPSRD